MKILSVNLGNYSSTGSIVQGIKSEAQKQGMEYVLAYPYDPYNKTSQKDDILIGNRFGRKFSIALGMATGFNGCFSALSTAKLLRRIEAYEPDILHFHNLHNNYINLPMLFGYLKKKKIKVVWTLHDCWSFTGQCPYFDMVGCDKWKTGCYSCPSYREYPKALVDNTKRMWRLKKKWFNGVENLTFVTPAEWLASMVKQSFLASYPVQVIHNGINLSVFQPINAEAAKERYGLTSKKIVLGVAFDWGKRKGLDVFAELALRLPEEYKIVLVGTNEEVRKALPDNILALDRTSAEELAELYAMADVFANPTRDEVFGLVNVEALACGTPGVTFDSGGSPECYDETCGSVVDCNDVDALEKEIIRICSEKPYTREVCVQRAAKFDKNKKFKEYVELYERIVTTGASGD